MSSFFIYTNMRKLQTYESFIINEMYLFIEEEFYETIDNIMRKYDDPVAKVLLKLGGGDFEKLRQTDLSIDLDNVGMIKFTNHPGNEKKQSATLGKVVNSIIKAVRQWAIEYHLDDPTADIIEKDVNNFVTRYKGEIQIRKDLSKHLEVVSGEDIRKYYNEENYYEKKGELGKSCMRHTHKGNFFDLYVNNPDVCQMLILRSPEDNEKILGRALLWNCSVYTKTGWREKFLKQGKLMDRIYATDQASMVYVFTDWANKNGYYYKEYQDNSDAFTAMLNGQENTEAKVFVVEVGSNSDIDNYPYLDTLKYYYTNEGIISNSENMFGIDYDLMMDEMNGTVDCQHCDDGYTECYSCTGKGQQDCDDCSGNGNTLCSICDGDGVISDGEEEHDCDECGGQGSIDCYICGGSGQVECGDCKGNGKLDKCTYCNGAGK